MADCDTLEGITLGCGNNIAGLKRIALVEKSSVTSITLNSPDTEIDEFTMAGSPPAEFQEFEIEQNTCNYVVNTTNDDVNGRDASEIILTMIFNRREKTKRDKLLLMVRRKKMVALVQDENDIWWYLGETRGLKMQTIAGGSGTVAETDPNQYVVTLRGVEPEEPNTVTDDAAEDVINAI